MQVCQKKKTLFWILFLHILNLVWILNILEKKMTLIAYLLLSWRPPKNVVRSMSKKSRFRLILEKQDGKRVPTLLKSERQNLYDIYWSMGRQVSCKKSLLLIC